MPQPNRKWLLDTDSPKILVFSSIVRSSGSLNLTQRGSAKGIFYQAFLLGRNVTRVPLSQRCSQTGSALPIQIARRIQVFLSIVHSSGLFASTQREFTEDVHFVEFYLPWWIVAHISFSSTLTIPLLPEFRIDALHSIITIRFKIEDYIKEE